MNVIKLTFQRQRESPRKPGCPRKRGRKVISRVNVMGTLEGRSVGEGQPLHKPLRQTCTSTLPVHFPVGRPPEASLAASLDTEGPGDTSLGGTVALPWGDTSGGQGRPDTCQVESPALLKTSSSSVSLALSLPCQCRERQTVL